jgi:hypothetical protein
LKGRGDNKYMELMAEKVMPAVNAAIGRASRAA